MGGVHSPERADPRNARTDGLTGRVPCNGDGDIGALLRRESFYSSLLATWRREVHKHGKAGLTAKRRSPAPKPKPSAREVELELRTRKLEKQLAKANAVIEFQKKCTRPWGSP